MRTRWSALTSTTCEYTGKFALRISMVRLPGATSTSFTGGLTPTRSPSTKISPHGATASAMTAVPALGGGGDGGGSSWRPKKEVKGPALDSHASGFSAVFSAAATAVGAVAAAVLAVLRSFFGFAGACATLAGLSGIGILRSTAVS